MSSQETTCQNIFSSRLYVREFFLHNSLVLEIFSYPYALAGYFFSKSPHPPPPEVKWLAPSRKNANKHLFISFIHVIAIDFNFNKSKGPYLVLLNENEYVKQSYMCEYVKQSCMSKGA